VALSEDQRAMLRLLAQREQGYEDIAALMGLSVEQVRAKVKEALEQIDSDEAPAPPAAPMPVAAEPPRVEPTSPADASKPVPAVEPKPAPKPPPPLTPPVAKPASSSLPQPSLPASRRRLIEWVGGAVIVILVVLFATGTIDLGGGGSDSSTTTAASSSENGEPSTAAANSSQATKAVLTPVSGGEGAGLALFGRIKKTAILQVEAKGLKPSLKGQSYTVWLYRSPKLVLRVGAVAVPKNGTIAAQFPIPAQVLAYVAGGAFDQIDVSRTPNAAYEAEVAQAKKQKRLPAYTGTDILRGKITGPAIQKK
jgi:hypothetical protein